jgi:hypothetical protein
MPPLAGGFSLALGLGSDWQQHGRSPGVVASSV